MFIRPQTTLVVLALSTLVVAACGGGDKSAGGGSSSGAAAKGAAPAAAVKGIKAGEKVIGICNTIAKDGECAEFVVTSDAEKAKSLEGAKALCPTFSDATACPAANQVTTCRVMKDIINHYYSAGGKTYAKDTGKAACEKQMGHVVD